MAASPGPLCAIVNAREAVGIEALRIAQFVNPATRKARQSAPVIDVTIVLVIFPARGVLVADFVHDLKIVGDIHRRTRAFQVQSESAEPVGLTLVRVAIAPLIRLTRPTRAHETIGGAVTGITRIKPAHAQGRVHRCE